MRSAHFFETPLGCFGIGWGETGLCRVLLPDVGGLPARARLSGLTDAKPSGWAAELVSDIRRYAEGAAVSFAGYPLDFAGAADFDRAIWLAARELAHGEATTYGELAARAGYPGHARPAGAALGRNPVPLVVPCHRVLAAGGRLGGFSAPGGVTAKVRLLLHERADTAPALPGQQAFSF